MLSLLHPTSTLGWQLICVHTMAGLQGVFIKRHRCTREDGGFFSPADFNVGETVTIYGRTFHLTDADSFTREFMAAQLGRDMGGPLGYPDDPVDAYRTTFGMNRGRADNSELLHAAGGWGVCNTAVLGCGVLKASSGRAGCCAGALTAR